MQGGGSASGSMSTVSRDDNWVLSSEDSSCPDESELELGLGLSLGNGGASNSKTQQGSRGQYARILTAKDLPSVVSSSSSSSAVSSSSSSSSTLSGANVTAGTKRSADSVAAANAGGQVVGWPPVRAHRMNSLSKSQATELHKSKNTGLETTIDDSDKNDGNAKDKGYPRSSSFVKVNMDGIAIGRKVDLDAHSCYETLAKTLEDMFLRPTTASNSIQEHSMMVGARRHSKLLDGSSGFALTYEDKDGDWMLVGDVPWRMFLSSVRRLRIMRTSEANGLAPRLQDRNARQRS